VPGREEGGQGGLMTATTSSSNSSASTTSKFDKAFFSEENVGKLQDFLESDEKMFLLVRTNESSKKAERKFEDGGRKRSSGRQ